jgi:hypothetical protein
MVFALGMVAVEVRKDLPDDWLAYVQPNIEDPIPKIYFSIRCFGYWIQNCIIPIPDCAVFVPILTDWVYLEEPKLNPCVCGLLLAYLDRGNDDVVEALYTHLNDGEIGEILRFRAEESSDVVTALREVLNPHPDSEFGAP